MSRKYRNQWIALSELRNHPKIQRDFDEKWARDIAADFNPDRLGELAVLRAPGKGHYYIFDGQHRAWAAAEALGADQKVPCHVYEGLSDQECAVIALGLNKRKSWRAIDKFAVRVVAKEPVAVDIRRIFRKIGLRPGSRPTPRTVRAVNACESVYCRYSPETLERTLRLLREVWPEWCEALDGSVIKGMAGFLDKYDQVMNEAHFLKRLSGHNSPVRLIGNARDWAKVARISVPNAVVHILVQEHDTRLRAASRIGGGE